MSGYYQVLDEAAIAAEYWAEYAVAQAAAADQIWDFLTCDGLEYLTDFEAEDLEGDLQLRDDIAQGDFVETQPATHHCHCISPDDPALWRNR